MKVKKYTILALGTVAFASAAMFSSCVKENPDSPGMEFMPDMYRGVGPEANLEFINDAMKDSMTNLLPPDGTVARGWTPFPYENNAIGDSLASAFWKVPASMRNDSVEMEGKFYYDRFCVYCHGDAGDGQGKLVTSEKYPNQPPSYLDLNKKGTLTDGHVYHVITYGKGVMGSHASQLSPEERWKVVLYVERLGRGNMSMADYQKKMTETVAADSTKAAAPVQPK